MKKNLSNKEEQRNTMATNGKTTPASAPTKSTSPSDDFSAELIRQINKARKDKIAFNLATDDAPTNIKRWVSTGSEQLDYIISNRPNGGLPEGRIIEISAEPGKGKSHLAYHAAKATQAMGGIVVYIDTENATSLDNLRNLGVDVSKRFVFIQTACTEEVFAAAEAAIVKARAMTTDVPVLVVWDSVAASSPKAELEGEYDQQQIGVNARVIGKGMRKIVNILGSERIVFLVINQTRIKVGVLHGDPMTTPGGMAIPFASSIRIRLQGGQFLKHDDKDETPYGIRVVAKTIKNKVAQPFRSCEFEIVFGQGVEEYEQIFDCMRLRCEREKGGLVKSLDGKYLIGMEGTAAYKTFQVVNAETGEHIVEPVRFYKKDFGSKIYRNPAYSTYMKALMDLTYIWDPKKEVDHSTFVGLSQEDDVVGQDHDPSQVEVVAEGTP